MQQKNRLILPVFDELGGEGFEPSKLSQQIYSLPPLATRESTHIMTKNSLCFQKNLLRKK